MGSKKQVPLFQLVDGIKIPLGFDPDKLRSSLGYEAFAGDIFIDTFPKCGTNWTKRIVQLLDGKDSHRDSDYGLSTSFFEMVGKDVIKELPVPRLVTSHLQYQYLPKHPQARYIYVVRNPKDCCVSYFHHTRKTKVYCFQDGTFDEYLQLFVDGNTSFGDYFDHLLSWYPRRNEPNVLFLTYEDMKKDTPAAVLKIARFLDVEDPELLDPTTSKFQKVVELCGVDSMKEYLEENYKKAVGGQDVDSWTAKKDYPLARAPPPPDVMVRKGIVGDWRNHFDSEQSRKMEAAFLDRCGSTIGRAEIWDPKDWMVDA